MQKVSDRDVHDQEVETLGRKLTEAEREAAAANVCFGFLSGPTTAMFFYGIMPNVLLILFRVSQQTCCCDLSCSDMRSCARTI